MSDELLMDLEKLLSLSAAHIYWIDGNNVYQGCNEKQARSAGLSSRLDIVGKKNSDLPWSSNPAMVAFIDNINLEVMSTGVPRIVEEPATLLDGTEAVFLSNKLPLYCDDGAVIGLLGISVDITSQKLQEARLKAEKKEATFTLDYILAHVPAHIYWKDKNGKYLGSNDRQAKSLGLNYGYELVGKTDFELPGEKSSSVIFRDNDLEVMSSGTMKTSEESAIFDGKESVVLSKKVPLRNSYGEITGVLGISIDITDRKKKEQARKEKEVVEKMSQALEMLSGCIAHEIRTPLSVISINTDNLQAELTKPLTDSSKKEQQSKIKEYINNIKFSIKNGSTIIDMLLVKLRGILNKQDPSHKFISRSIKSGINYVLDVYPFYDNERELVVWDDEANEDFDYFGDEIWTSHVLFNLMKNAIRIIKEEERGKIYISLKRGGKFNYLIFKDTAIGISDEIFKTLFAQFNSGSRGGTGLGLAFCKMVMQSYGGDITCDSKYGEYTEFTLSFPVQQK